MQADPTIQSPQNLQNYNRFSYVDNNPLTATDPSGYRKFWKQKWFKKAVVTVVVIVVSAYTAGAAYAAMASYGTIAAGAAAGAASGAIMGAVSGFAATGNLAGAVRGALTGAAVGAVTGAAGGALGQGTLGRMLNGGLNGYMQTGTTEGFARGMLSGAVPTDLGMTESFNTNAWANAAINVARDGIRGGIINGSDGARTSIAAGLTMNAVGHGIGLIRTGSFGEFSRGGWNYTVNSLPENADAITLGNVVHYNGANAGDWSKDYTSWLISHEMEHAQAQSAMGVAYVPAHLVSQSTGLYFGEEAPYTAYPYGSNPPRNNSPSWYW